VKIYYVETADPVAEAQETGSKPLGAQAQDAQAQPTLAQIATLRMVLNDDFTVTVGDVNEPFVYPAYGTLAQTTFTVDDLDLATVQADLASGEHQAVAVYLDMATNELAYIAIDAVTATDALPARIELGAADFATFNQAVYPSYSPVGIVYLYYGQSGFVAADQYSLPVRTFFPPVSAYSSQVAQLAAVATANNTATLIAAIPVAELSAVVVTGEVVGAKTDYSAALGATFTAVARRASGGNVTLVASVTPSVVEDSAGSPTVAVTANTGTQTIDIKVTGITAEDWSWRVNYRTVTP
jgi:hypothetical protein